MVHETGELNGRLAVAEFRRALVLAPVEGDGLLATDFGGVRWLHAFTGEPALSRFAVARGMVEGAEVPYMTVYGARLLDVVVSAVGVPAGVVVDVVGPSPLLLPPVAGIVPDAVAVGV
jgi:hypothetical protein